MIEVWKNKKMMMMTMTIMMIMTMTMTMTTTTMMMMMIMMMMKDAFEDKRIVSSKFSSGETGKEGRKQKQEV
jgi:hypothetical protein